MFGEKKAKEYFKACFEDALRKLRQAEIERDDWKRWQRDSEKIIRELRDESANPG